MSKLLYFPLLLSLFLLVGCGSSNKEEKDTAQQPQPQKPAPPAPKPGGIFKAQGPPRVVDYLVATRENPKLVPSDPATTDVGNPLSKVVNKPIEIGGKLDLIRFKQWVDGEHILNEKYPTFEEFKKMTEQNASDYKTLRPWQMLAYNSETGEISILEDPDIKAEYQSTK